MIVQSLGALQSYREPVRTAPPFDTSSHWSYSAYAADYAALYRTQPAVRTVVDFLARNVAQLGLHVYRRVDDTDRERLTDHDLAQWIEKPNFATTRYRLFEALM